VPVTDPVRTDGNGNGRDPRLDRVANWALQTFMSVAIAVGGWYAKGTGDKVDAVLAAQAETRTDIAVMQSELARVSALAADNAELRRLLTAMQLQVTALQAEVSVLRRDFDRPR
jgi:hypothetical protein